MIDYTFGQTLWRWIVSKKEAEQKQQEEKQ